MDLGTKCTACSLVDFLPILCTSCDQYFCGGHVSSHPCTTRLVVVQEDSSTGKAQRCALDNCDRPSLGRSACEYCSELFCAHHRHPKSHSCHASNVSQPAPKNEAARALLAKHFGGPKATPSAAPTPKVPTDPAKLAQYKKIQMMKLRRSAIPADPKDFVQLESRWHLQVEGQKAFWVRKSHSAGRVLDLIAVQLNLGRSDTLPLQMFKLSDSGEQVELEYGKPIDSQVEDGERVVVSRKESV